METCCKYKINNNKKKWRFYAHETCQVSHASEIREYINTFINSNENQNKGKIVWKVKKIYGDKQMSFVFFIEYF